MEINTDNLRNDQSNENNTIQTSSSTPLKYPTLKNLHQSHILDYSKKSGEIESVNGVYSNDFVVVSNSKEYGLQIKENQRLRSILLLNNEKLKFNILDSAVIFTRTIRIIKCKNSNIILQDTDIRRIEIWDSENIHIVILSDPVQVETLQILIHPGNKKISISYLEFEYDLQEGFYRSRIVNEQCIEEFGKEEDNEINKIMIVQILNPPLFDIHEYNIDDKEFKEKIKWLQKMTKTIEFSNEATNKKLEGIVTSNEVIQALEDLKKIPYNLTKEEIKLQYDEERKEFSETINTILPKIKQIASLIKSAKHCIVFTGAGVSTSADIPDFRGPQGIWTKEDKKQKITYGTDINETKPTYCHYALTELAKRGLIKFLITTNMDGLHWRSGFPEYMLEELHGSAYTEHCPQCHKHFRRLKEVDRGAPDHLTGNVCDFCGRGLLDTIVNFNEDYRNPLEETIVKYHSLNADLVIVLGTSCFVMPAACYPEKVKLSEKRRILEKLYENEKNEKKIENFPKKGNLVLVNLQATPLDEYCDVRIFTYTDIFAKELMKELGITDFDVKYDAIKENKIIKDINNTKNKCSIF